MFTRSPQSERFLDVILLIINDDDFVFHCDFGTVVMVLFVFSEYLLLAD